MDTQSLADLVDATTGAQNPDGTWKSNAEVRTALMVASTNHMMDRGLVDAYEVINATVPGEWTALSASEKQRYQTLTGAGRVDTANNNVRSAFKDMFGSGTTTRTNLMALLTRPGSVLESVGETSVERRQIQAARELRWET